MAQGDMNIANQGFPAFRADLNDQLEALVTNSSGATAPATTFPHQWWLDTSTTPSTLRQRNAANDAWIVVGLLNQSTNTFNLPVAQGGTGLATLTANNVLLGNGTSAVQAVAPGTSGNVLTSNGTTWQSTAPGDNFTNISYTGTLTGGTGVINIGSGQLYKDASGNVGLGTSSPGVKFDIFGTDERIRIGDGTNVLTFGQWDGSNNRIESAGRSLFLTSYAGSIDLGPSGNVRMRLESNGQQLSVVPGGATLLPEFKCRAWVNFNGSNGSIRGSGGVSSVTRNASGNYTINLSTALPDTNYIANVTAGQSEAQGRWTGFNPASSSACTVTTQESTGLGYDPLNVGVSIHR
jgi:hypothetical protein